MMENAATSERDFVTPSPSNSHENIPEQTGPLSLSSEISPSDGSGSQPITVVPSNNDDISSSSDDVELTTVRWVFFTLSVATLPPFPVIIDFLIYQLIFPMQKITTPTLD